MASKMLFSIQLELGKLLLQKIKKKTVDAALMKHAPLEKKNAIANHAPFINKSITKEIMKLSCLRNKFLINL